MVEPSPKRNIILIFLSWHFADMPKKILQGWKNFLLSNLNYFSFGQLLKSFFSHWHRIKDSYGRGFDIQVYFSTFVANMISRLLGMVIRTVIIAAGVFFEIIIFVAGLVVLAVWIFWPVLVVAGFVYAVGLLV